MILGSLSVAARRAPLRIACHHRPATAAATATTGADPSLLRRHRHASTPVSAVGAVAVASVATPPHQSPSMTRALATSTQWHTAGGWTGTGTGGEANHPHSQRHSLQQPQNIVRRDKHSSRQVKRLFKKNPARARVTGRIRGGDGDGPSPPVMPPPMEPTYPPVFEFRMLPNGWSAPPGEDFDVPEYPFRVGRTKNKPNGAVGFLPVYTDFRVGGSKVTTLIKKVSGDREAFLRELHVQIDRAIRRRSSADDDADSDVPPHRRVSRNKGVEMCVRTGGTIEVNGNFAKEVRAWLAGLGF